MKSFEITKEVVGKTILGMIGLFTGLVGLTPQLGEDFGKIMDGIYSQIPQIGWGIITFFVFVAWGIWNYLDYRSSKNKEKEKLLLEAKKNSRKPRKSNTQKNSGGNNFQDVTVANEIKVDVKTNEGVVIGKNEGPIYMGGKKKDIESEKMIKEILDLLSSFEKKFETARHSSDTENNLDIFKETEFELHKIGMEYLPKIDLLLNNSEQLKGTFNDLFRYSNIYGIELRDFLNFIKAGKVGEEYVIQKGISLRTDNGKAYSQVKKYINLFRQELKDRLP